MPFPDDIDVESPNRIDRLKVAYALHVARKVMEADNLLDLREVEMLMSIFNPELLEGCEYIDEAGRLTGVWESRLTEAAALLPIELSKDEKLELCTIFVRVQLVDDEKDPRESEVIQAAASHLGLTRGDLAAHLMTLGL